MAKAPTASSSPFDAKLADIEDQIAEQEQLVEEARQEYLKDTTNAEARAALQAAKAPLMQLSIDRGFYARAKSELAGGTSHMPPA